MIVLGLDPVYVGTHHFARFLVIGFALPAIVAGVMPRPVEPTPAVGGGSDSSSR